MGIHSQVDSAESSVLEARLQASFWYSSDVNGRGSTHRPGTRPPLLISFRSFLASMVFDPAVLHHSSARNLDRCVLSFLTDVHFAFLFSIGYRSINYLSTANCSLRRLIKLRLTAELISIECSIYLSYIK